MIPALFVLGLSFYSCGNRATDNDEVKIKQQDEHTTEEDMFQTSSGAEDEMSREDMVEIAEAKEIVNDYYGAIGRSQPRAAYDLMDAKSSRGTFSEFSEQQSKYEDVKVNFTDDATVNKSGGNYTVTLPIRYTGMTSQGSSESYTGKAILKKPDTEDGKYTISSLDVNREDS